MESIQEEEKLGIFTGAYIVFYAIALCFVF